MDATPRRLVLRAEGLPERQADAVEKVDAVRRGPPRPRRWRALPASWAWPRRSSRTEATAKGEYYCFLRKVPGRPARDILAEALPGVILKIPFPKTMYWTGKGGPRFIRPIRWLVALLGEEVVPFEIAGVRAGNVTAGHRRLGAAPRLPSASRITTRSCAPTS